MKTLLLTLEYPSRASYYDDWKDAFLAAPDLQVTALNLFQAAARRRIGREIERYDLVVVLHSCTADTIDDAESIAPMLQGRRGRLVAFVGNELNLPWAPLGRKIAWLKSIAPDIIATQLPIAAGEWLYKEVNASVLALPHALNPRFFRPLVPQSARSIDIGARSYRYLAYLGDDDRNRVYDYFARNRFDPPLAIDFSNKHRFDRTGWADFLNRCKATISTEAGSWYLERNDATVMAIRDYAARSSGFNLRSDSTLVRVARRFPYPVKSLLRRVIRLGLVSYEAVDAEAIGFEEIQSEFFAERAKAPVYSKCISSRHFDAIGCQTLQIMFPGQYNGILRAGEHYVALAPDFANIDAVLDTLRSDKARRTIVERAYEDVMSAHTYAHRLQQLFAVLR